MAMMDAVLVVSYKRMLRVWLGCVWLLCTTASLQAQANDANAVAAMNIKHTNHSVNDANHTIKNNVSNTHAHSTDLDGLDVHSARNIAADVAVVDDNTDNTKVDIDSAALLGHLANSVLWQRLLLLDDAKMPDKAQVDGVPTGATDYMRTSIKDKSFFVSPSIVWKNDLYINPHQEAQAMYDLMVYDDARACRFAARRQAVIDALSLDAPKCADFAKWQQDKQGAMSVVFAEEHHQNLAQTFAHVFIKTDAKNPMVINYTVDENDIGIGALTGKANSVMQIMDFASKKQSYHDQRRNLWQYHLRLSDAQKLQILRHVYEIKDIQRAYVFTNNNCATEIARFVDLVSPKHNTVQAMGAIGTPTKLVQVLQAQNLLTDAVYLPYESILQNAHVKNIQAQHTYTLNTDTNHTHALTLGKLKDASIYDANPTAAKGMHRLSIDIGHTQAPHKARQYASIGLQAASKDLLDRPHGIRKFLDLQVLSLNARLDNNEITLDNLVFLSNKSYEKPAKSSHSNLFGAQGQSIQMVNTPMNASNKNSHVNHHKVLQVSKQIGRSYINQNTLCYALLGLNAQAGKHILRAGTSAQAGCVRHITPNLRTKIDIDAPIFWQKNKQADFAPKLLWALQYDATKAYALRLQGSYLPRAQQRSAQIAVMRYF